MKTKLSMALRIKLSELLSNEIESYARLKQIRTFREGLSFSEAEQKAVGYHEQPTERGTTMSYVEKPQNDPMKEFVVGEIMLEIICAKLRKLDVTKNLQEDQVDLYEVFAAEIAKREPKTEQQFSPRNREIGAIA